MSKPEFEQEGMEGLTTDDTEEHKGDMFNRR